MRSAREIAKAIQVEFEETYDDEFTREDEIKFNTVVERAILAAQVEAMEEAARAVCPMCRNEAEWLDAELSPSGNRYVHRDSEREVYAGDCRVSAIHAKLASLRGEGKHVE